MGPQKTATLATSLLVSITIALYFWTTIPLPTALFLKLTQWYGFLSLAFLFAVLFPGPFYRIFPQAPFAISHRAYLSALGISTFYFALLHSTIAFWGLLEGFGGLPFLPPVYFWAMIFGFLALAILAALGGTSFDYFRIKMGPNWKRLHRFVYAAGFLTAAHTAMAGSHFQKLSDVTPTIWMILFFALVILHAITLNRYLAKRFPQFSVFFFPFLIALAILLGLFILNLLHNYAHGSHH